MASLQAVLAMRSEEMSTMRIENNQLKESVIKLEQTKIDLRKAEHKAEQLRQALELRHDAHRFVINQSNLLINQSSE